MRYYSKNPWPCDKTTISHEVVLVQGFQEVEDRVKSQCQSAKGQFYQRAAGSCFQTTKYNFCRGVIPVDYMPQYPMALIPLNITYLWYNAFYANDFLLEYTRMCDDSNGGYMGLSGSRDLKDLFSPVGRRSSVERSLDLYNLRDSSYLASQIILILFINSE